jgi:hypothetical protein
MRQAPIGVLDGLQAEAERSHGNAQLPTHVSAGRTQGLPLRPSAGAAPHSHGRHGETPPACIGMGYCSFLLRQAWLVPLDAFKKLVKKEKLTYIQTKPGYG